MPEQRNSYRDTGLEDTLNEIRQELASKKAGNSAQKKFTPEAYIPVTEYTEFTDLAEIDPDKQTATETLGYDDVATSAGFILPWQVMDGDAGIPELKGFYKFNQDAVDSSGNGNNLTLTGSPTYVAGKMRHAIKFDGSTQYAQAASNAIHDKTTGDFSVNCWIYWTADAGAATIVRKRSTGSTDVGFNIFISSSDKLSAQLCDGSASVIQTNGATSLVVNSGWYMLTVNFDRDGLMRPYLNGVADNAGNSIAAQALTLTNTQTFTVARRSSGASEFLAAYMDDLRVYDRLLTQAEITNLYNNGLVGIGSLVERPMRVGFGEVA